MNWDALVRLITPCTVRIATPDGVGTGFLCMYNNNRQWIGIATAAHVVNHAEQWQQPIRITSDATGNSHLIPPAMRLVLTDMDADSSILVIPNLFNFTQDLISFLPASSSIPIGTSVGWLGFPSNTLCFFTGIISAAETRSYLIDGISIPGVSGGPVFYFDRTVDTTHIVGVITAYRQYGETFPGLSIAQDVSHFNSVLKTFNDINDSDRARREFQQLMDTLNDPE